MDGKRIVILITGCAGFIGGALSLRLLKDTNIRIIGLDNMNDYYDVKIKEYRLNQIDQTNSEGRFQFIKGDICDRTLVEDIFEKYHPQIVVHLAAQAGVRYSIENPDVYIQSNIIGFYNMLEACRKSMKSKEKEERIDHFVYASSSSVYGNNTKIPYSVKDMTDHPVSLYAATKKSDEVIAYAYSKLYQIPMTGLRFFTVYGPAGRPDMAYYKFTNKLISNERLSLYNHGRNKRDFTYISDVLNAIEKIIWKHPKADQNGSLHKIYNVGNNAPVDVITFVRTLERALKRTGILDEKIDIECYIDLIEAQQGDVDTTYADIDELSYNFDLRPVVKIDEGLYKFAEWYKDYYML